MAVDQERKKLADQLYELYGKPLEAEHWGEYVAISAKGQTIVGPKLLDVAQQASIFGSETFLFKIGPKAIGKWR